MSNTDIDYIESELRATSSPGNKIQWPPPTNSTHWHNAYTRLESLRSTPAPSPAPTPAPSSQPEPPAFTPKRTLPAATTYAELTTAIAALQPGDRLPAAGVTIPASATFSKKLTAAAEIVFDSTCKFAAGKGLRYPSIYINGAAYLRLICDGALVENPTEGDGIDIVAADHCVLDGWDVRSCATAAMSMRSTDGPITNNYVRATVRDWALVPSLDDHAEKGTGLHGLLVENSHTAYRIDNNTFVLTTPGSKMGGSLLEVGTSQQALAPTGNQAWLSAANLLQDAVTQTAGNALNLWGYIGTLDVVSVTASGLHGYAVHSAPSASYGAVGVDTGSGVNCCLNPRYAGQSPWMSNGGVKYAPGPFQPAA